MSPPAARHCGLLGIVVNNAPKRVREVYSARTLKGVAELRVQEGEPHRRLMHATPLGAPALHFDLMVEQSPSRGLGDQVGVST